ncbi:MAG: insulinase family protein, partial [Bacteroidales bacterium]|nr:insulinase family protein [Bacteroidales bacterium]
MPRCKNYNHNVKERIAADMLDRRIAPHQQRILPFQLKSPEKLVLSNGLPIFIFDNERLDLIHFAVRIWAGSLFENRKFLANPTYNLLMESVPDMTSGDVEDKLDFYGAVFQSSVNFEYVTLNFIIPKSTLKNVLPFLCAMISSPVYKEENLSLFKQRKIKELEFNSQKINWVAGQMLYHAFLHPQVAASQMLSKEHIETLSTDLLQQYHQSTFCAENISLFVSGNINPEIMVLVQHLFSQILSGNQAELPGNLLIDNNCGRTIFEKREDSLQSSLMLGRTAMAYESEDRRLFSVASAILGGYFGSRLMQNLREKNGYTYGIQAYSSYFGDA